MQNPIQEKIMAALLEALRPIIRALLRSGIGFREFTDVAKTAFVEVATKDYGIRGRPTNISRVAVMTGLTRKEVKRLRDNAPAPGSLLDRRSPASDLLHYWYTDSEFLDGEGKPKRLPYADDPVSFCNLVKCCAGDVPPGAMRTELKRIGAIVEHENGQLEPVKRYFIPGDVGERLELGLNLGLAPLGSTVAFNCDPDRKGPARFQRVSDSAWIDKDNLLALQDNLSARLEGFLTEVDQKFAEVEVSHEYSDRSNLCQVGVGVFFFASED